MQTLHIIIPEWAESVSNSGIKRPFPLWDVADQPLLHHWFDLAQESDYGKVIVHGRKAPLWSQLYFKLRNYWPIPIEFTSSPPPADRSGPTHDVVGVETLNATSNSLSDHPDIWDILDHHWNLTTDRLEVIANQHKRISSRLRYGRMTQIAPWVELVEPYQIGKNCTILEGARIGPYACIGDNSIIGNGAQIVRSHLGAKTLVGPSVHLDGHFIEEQRVFNRSNKIQHAVIDPLMIRSNTLFRDRSNRGQPALSA